MLYICLWIYTIFRTSTLCGVRVIYCVVVMDIQWSKAKHLWNWIQMLVCSCMSCGGCNCRCWVGGWRIGYKVELSWALQSICSPRLTPSSILSQHNGDSAATKVQQKGGLGNSSIHMFSITSLRLKHKPNSLISQSVWSTAAYSSIRENDNKLTVKLYYASHHCSHYPCISITLALTDSTLNTVESRCVELDLPEM